MSYQHRSPRRTEGRRVPRRGVTAAHVCASASHSAAAAALENLGPVIGRGETLDQSVAAHATLVAGEQVAHLMEAWQYMGAAMRSTLCNSDDNAVHFAYYAQLRAALSIFAGSGIRVRLGESFYLDNRGEKVDFQLAPPIGNRTHPMAWAIWDEWVKTPYARDLMGENMSIVSGISLAKLSLIPASSGALLNSWGYDLARGATDHDARNVASYQAKSRQPSPLMSVASIELIRRMWTLLLGNGDGVLFDATLVRYFVERYIAATIVQGAEDGVTLDRQTLLGRMIKRTSANTGVSESILHEVFAAQVDTTLFDYASAEEANPENVLSRALFLVRVATLSLAENLKAGSKDECKSWLSHWLQGAGLYQLNVHDGPSAIAADYEEALDEFDSVDLSNLPSSIWIKDKAQCAALLSRPEGFVGWGLPL